MAIAYKYNNSTNTILLYTLKKSHFFYTFLKKTKNRTIYIYKRQRTTDNRLRTCLKVQSFNNNINKKPLKL